MEIRLVLAVADPRDVNRDDESGLTTEAYIRLMNALERAGFEPIQHPRQVTWEQP